MNHRVISLIASATEIVAALGYEDALVGRSHECDFPPAVEKLPVCSEPRIDVSGTSLEIDVAVKGAVKEALSVYSVFKDELERLQPTVIVTQTQCEVCAVNLKDVQAAVCELVDSNPQIVACEPMGLSDIWIDIQNVANALNDPEAAIRLNESLIKRLQGILTEYENISHRPTLACIEWLEPIMIAGNWVPELVRIAGGEAVMAEDGKHSPYQSWEELAEIDPEVIAIMPCGFDIQRTIAEIELLTNHPLWNSLQAVNNNRVYITDGNQYFNRPGPRVVESAEILVEILHDTDQPKHHGTGWIRLEEC
ncbi:MAG: cobalamin-binding protein [Planctomicrobium sp.]|jgi:iron complex transport system substrate-binding protein|nr:cobalamin-binding protein [Planctomicrobium sp.]